MAVVKLPDVAYNLDNDHTDEINAVLRTVEDGDTILAEHAFRHDRPISPCIDPDKGDGAYRTLKGAEWVGFGDNGGHVRAGAGVADTVTHNPGLVMTGLVRNTWADGPHFTNLQPPAVNTGYTTREYDHAVQLIGQDAAHPQGMQLCAGNRMPELVIRGWYGDGISFEVGPNAWAYPYGNELLVKRITGVGRHCVTMAAGGWVDQHGNLHGNRVAGLPNRPMFLDALRSILDLEATGEVHGFTFELFHAGPYGTSFLSSQGNGKPITDVTIRSGISEHPLKVTVHPAEGVRNERWTFDSLTTDWPAGDPSLMSIHRTDVVAVTNVHQPTQVGRCVEFGADAAGTSCTGVTVAGCRPKAAFAPYQK